ncbi:MAG: GNAT family N-acetyltransferase [Chitinophagales bacterium]|nr:GNAT family N-acetyltransferase [Bacteroidota bacterium]MBK7566364.1 GNAT family N-acetyltransferase [Bacteroidota bacterium]MBP8915748.1 GNAT family N-acetyltransferase [Chitinophagales bacterium]MBP9220433.1 GNAT family N-acetyltransferase [Chitinophagales bacterium]MBP9796753.1 GNAT family N-acetyltransferase [Chitinophagales bacterium]
MKTTVQHKNWDSNFLGFRVGDLYTLCDENFLSQQLIKYKEEGYRLLYWKIEEQDVDSLTIAKNLHLHTYDTKVTYQLSLVDNKPVIPSYSIVQNYSGAITSELIELGKQSGDFSRFHNDKNFPPGTFEKMYAEWILNSFSAEQSDAIFILEENAIMFGFATVFFNEDDAEIVLIAIEPEYRNKGYAKMLVDHISGYVYAEGYRNLYVVTQEQNIAACKLYERCGFTMIKKEYIYHIWL